MDDYLDGDDSPVPCPYPLEIDKEKVAKIESTNFNMKENQTAAKGVMISEEENIT